MSNTAILATSDKQLLTQADKKCLLAPSLTLPVADGLIWTKYNNVIPAESNTTSTDGRIPDGTTGKADAQHTYSGSSCILYDGGVYKYYYSTNPGGASTSDPGITCLATSPDGFTWTKYNNAKLTASDTTGTDGRIPGGTSTKQDNNYAHASSVLKVGSTYYLWYMAGKSGVNYSLCLATSTDGLTWTKYNNDAVATRSDSVCVSGQLHFGNTGRADSVSCQIGTVIYDGGIFKCWYTGYNNSNYRILYATSPDGITWTKYNNAIESPSDTTGTDGRIPLGTNGKGDDNWTATPSVLKINGGYKMWYAGHDGSTARIFHATSPDGLTWTKYNNVSESPSDTTGTDGRIPLGTSGKGDSVFVRVPCVIIVGQNLHMYYQARGSSDAYDIYLARSIYGA